MRRLRRDPLSALRTPVGFTVVLLLVVWLVFPLLPEGSGLQFGAGYQLFFSGIVVGAGLFFWLLGLGPMAQPRSGLGVASSIALVYVVTVGALVAAGNSYLQFSIPSADGQVLAELGPAELGERLFWSTPPGCFLCHSIGSRGGQRAPDMAGMATRAGTRVPGVAAEEYLDGHIRQGLNYPYTVPEYAPIMPPYGSSLSDAEIAALVAYLMSLE
jgi:mono/diheme cytochrome c family protein